MGNSDQATILQYTSGLLNQTAINAFTPDNDVTAIYAYDSENKADSCKGHIIWLDENEDFQDSNDVRLSGKWSILEHIYNKIKSKF